MYHHRGRQIGVEKGSVQLKIKIFTFHIIKEREEESIKSHDLERQPTQKIIQVNKEETILVEQQQQMQTLYLHTIHREYRKKRALLFLSC